MDTYLESSSAIPTRGYAPIEFDWASPASLDEVVTELEDALTDEPERVRSLLLALEEAIATQASTIGRAGAYTDVAFESGHYQRRIGRLRNRYHALGERALRLQEALWTRRPAVGRLLRDLARVQAEESELVAEALWTDSGSVD